MHYVKEVNNISDTFTHWQAYFSVNKVQKTPSKINTLFNLNSEYQKL